VTRHTPFRRLLALLLLGGVVAASSGMAIHDPDCPHHASGATGPVGVESHGAHHGGHEAGSTTVPDGPTSADCECIGFCALAESGVTIGFGAVPPSVAIAPVARVTLPEVDVTHLRSAFRALQPPATGPPFEN
jgi:hypothetical protein